MTTPHPAKSAPQPIVLQGRFVRLEPLAQKHAADIYEISSMPGGTERYRWLFSTAPESLGEVEARIAEAVWGENRYVAVVEQQTGKTVGQQGWMRIRPEHASIEIGGVYWGLPMARTPLATEALYLFARHAFDDLGYRRFEWKCNDLNAPSKAAARRFGFQYEGLFRQDMILKGESRDTAWFAMIDSDWPALRAEYERWLNPDNFAADGTQKSRLETGAR